MVQWLQDIGYTPPAVEKVQVGLSYGTRLYHHPANTIQVGPSSCLVQKVPNTMTDRPVDCECISKYADCHIIGTCAVHPARPSADKAHLQHGCYSLTTYPTT